MGCERPDPLTEARGRPAPISSWLVVLIEWRVGSAQAYHLGQAGACGKRPTLTVSDLDRGD
jgi:hypothetical protein